MFLPLRHRLHRALRAAGIRQAIGGFDISANEHANGEFASHWRPQAIGDAKALFDLAQNQNAAVRRQQTAIEFGDDCLAGDR